MKNFFSNTIKKAKNFITNLTPIAKLKYIVISVLTVAVAASLLVVVALNTGKPETPTNPKDFETGETASLDFDTEIIYEIGGESSSVSTTDSMTDDTSVATDASSDTDEPTSDEESSSVVTDNNTETTDEAEPQPTDPSQDYNPDPQPEDNTDAPVVNPYPTETTTQTQTTPKPTETTTKQPQTEPKPTETTTKQTQAEPKPTETTTKATETEPKPTETTKPQENTPQPTGQFSLKEKKYDYNGANVSIVQVESKSQQAHTITITGKFKDANGKIVKSESKTFEGFPAGWSNYFVFQPSVKYSSVTWEMETVEFSSEPAAKYITAGNTVALYISSLPSDGNGNLVMPTSPEEAAKCKNCVSLIAEVGNIRFPYKFNGEMSFLCDLVLFDNNGEIFSIGTPGEFGCIIYHTNSISVEWPALITDVLWENKDTYNILDDLNNATAIMAIKSVELSGN